MVDQSFMFPEKVLIEVQDEKGVIEERSVRVTYPYRLQHCPTCGGFRHHKCREKSWEVLVDKGTTSIGDPISPRVSLSESMSVVRKKTIAMDSNSNLGGYKKRRWQMGGCWKDKIH